MSDPTGTPGSYCGMPAVRDENGRVWVRPNLGPYAEMLDDDLFEPFSETSSEAAWGGYPTEDTGTP